jgi:hypothetical protein
MQRPTGTSRPPATFVTYRTNGVRTIGGGDGVTKAEEYRAKARECEERAAQTRDSFIKQQMLEVAAKWQQMADYEEKRSR